MTTWFNETSIEVVSAPSQEITNTKIEDVRTLRCPSCGHTIQLHDQTTILHDFPGLPAGVKFDPSDQEILEHLEAKALADRRKIHPLIDEFIPTIDGENGICYTHPDKLPGVSKDGQIRHFFHRPSKAYTTGTRKRRKVHTDADGGETRWHKTGKTRPVFAVGILKGYKKILVLYTNYGRQRKPEKTNWVMHQYHLGSDEEEKDGEFVVSKVFYQTQPRQSNNTNNVKEIEKISSKSKSLMLPRQEGHSLNNMDTNFMEYYGSPQYINSPTQLIPNMVVHGHGGGGSSFVHLASTASKGK